MLDLVTGDTRPRIQRYAQAMEPVTHFMTGAVLARAGFNRRAAYAILAMTLAAEAPDLDTLWSLRGPVVGFEHHRGWTHTLLGLPIEAFIVLGAIYLWHLWRTRSDKPLASPPVLDHTIPEPQFAPQTRKRVRQREIAPVRWPLLYAFILVALLSHILLDWSNNYGLRPFFPFDPHWYAGSFIFIFEPVMFLLLLIGLVAPAFFGLIGAEVGARRQPFRGRGWAVAAISGVALLWGFRSYEHAQAETLARAGEYNNAPILRTSLSPYPGNPFLWHAVVETPDFSQVGTANTWTGSLATTEQEDRFYKPPVTLATLAADRTSLGHAYLDWSQFPLVTESSGTPADLDPATPNLTTVTFRDLRFLYDTSLLHGREHPPLSGTVLLDGDRRVLRMAMDGHVQH